MEEKIRRQKAVLDARRSMVLAAAKSVFAQSGVEHASIREIAKRAGYTPGAIYAYFDSKHALFAALMEEALGRLADSVKQAKAPRGRAHGLAHARALAWFAFLSSHSRDLELILYLMAGVGQQTLSAEVTQSLQVRLRQTLEPCVEALIGSAVTPAKAHAEREALLAHGLGLLLVQNSSGLAAEGTNAGDLFIQYLDGMAARLGASSGAADVLAKDIAPEAPQVNLFDH